MKTLISLLTFMIPTILWGEMICPLIEGCPIKKGICIGCIEKPKEDLIKPIIQSKKVQLEETKRKPIQVTKTKKKKDKKKPVVKTKPTKPKSWKGTLFKCKVGCLYPYWDSGGNNYDKDLNLITKGKPIEETKPKKKGNWECIVPPFDFIDEDGNLIED